MMMLFGLIFGIVGIFSSVALFIAWLNSGELMLLGMSALFGLVFCGIGFGMVFQNVKAKSKKNKILKEGTQYSATIVDYKDGSGVVVNGVSPLDLIVNAYINGEERIITVPTGEYSTAQYPIGGKCKVAILGVDARIVPDSVTMF